VNALIREERKLRSLSRRLSCFIAGKLFCLSCPVARYKEFIHTKKHSRAIGVRWTDFFGVSVPLPPPVPEELESEWQGFLSGFQLKQCFSDKN